LTTTLESVALPRPAPSGVGLGRAAGWAPVHSTRYARSGRHHLAYQVVGDGPVDVVFVPGFVSNIELQWQLPGFSEVFDGLASFCRLIVFDKRGTGLSDRVNAEELPSLHERVQDIRAVMDAAGSTRATVIGVSEGGPMAVLFAVTHPERVERLVIAASFDDAAVTVEGELDRDCSQVERLWGTGQVFGALAPSWRGDEVMMRHLARYERNAASPPVASHLVASMRDVSLTPWLASVRQPATVIHRRGDGVFSIERARRMASALPRGELVELEGDDHLVFAGDTDGFLAAIEARVVGSHRAGTSSTRALKTVVFIDLVGSTAVAGSLGDRRWRDMLHRFYRQGCELVTAGGGTVVKTTGDGLLATFDLPSDAVRSAISVRDVTARLGLAARAGVHTAEVEMVDRDVSGIGVHVAARVAGAAAAGEVWVTPTVRDVVAGSGLQFAARGRHDLQGLPEQWDLLAAQL
jgi:pimeloyl-ACP methyl ester carboxylesterase